MRRALWLLSLVLIVILSGCSDGTATVSGMVTYQGRPVTSGSVIVVNEDGTAESGVIQPDSSYSVERVKRGHVRLGVFSPDPAHARSILRPEDNRSKAIRKTAKTARAGEKAASGWFPIPHHLGDPTKSGLTCDVDSSSVHYDIEMK
jgi:hypothetical protein